jgi:nucleotide-binding universal stress UspA family protein
VTIREGKCQFSKSPMLEPLPPFVRKMASRYQSEVILLHVLRPLYLLPEARLWPPHAVSLPEWVLLQQIERLQEFGRTQWGDSPVRHLVVEGDPEEQIVATARAEKAHLVAMPTHGYGRFR